MQRLLAVVIAGITTLPIVGCSSDDVAITQVTGEVTFNGRPTTAEIIFEPVEEDETTLAGRPSTAFADTQGTFTMNYSPGRQGAQVGLHRVSITITNLPHHTGDEGLQDNRISAKTTRVIRNVRPGQNHFQFAVTL